MEVRRATAADRDAVVATLVDSHLDYVWELWAITGPDRREKLTALVRAHVELIALPNREVWMSSDGAGVAIWRSEPEEPVDARANTRLAEVGRSVFGSRLAVIEEVDEQVLARRPTEPHRFLATMGVLPHRQREGVGSAVLRPVLDELDRTGTPACLETSALGNVEFYGRLGFTVHAHLDDLPAGAPETWILWRPPSR